MSHIHKIAQLLLSIVIILLMGVSLAQPETASAQGEDGLKRQFNAQTGKISFIGPETGRSLSAAKALGISPSDRPANPAMALAKRFGPEFGLKNPGHDLAEMKTYRPSDGRVTVRYQQQHQGIPVLGGELIINTNQNGDLFSINGEISQDISLHIQPTVDSEQAIQTALQSLAKWYQKAPENFLVSEPELWIYDENLLRPSTRPLELVWRLEAISLDDSLPVRELVLVSAQRGGISLHFNQVDTTWNLSVDTNTAQTLGTNTTSFGAETFQRSGLQSVPTSIRTYTAGNSISLPGTYLCDQTDPTCAPGDTHAKAAHKYAIGTYNLFQNDHNRNSIDNNNMPVISTVHYDVEYQNAFWSGEQMVYGDGYGFALADDVVAHELTHGVTQHESNLFYYYQSGAINESFSDLWGEYYDQTNGQGTDTASVKWLVGEDISGLGAIRSMSNPPAFGNPDKMSSAYYYKGIGDNGGVHYNSGVNNKAVFLMVDGGTFNGKTVSAIGWVKTAAIYYEANTNLLSSGADYSDLYFALQKACSNLIGQKGITPTDCQEVKDAIDAVEMNMQPAPNFNTDAPLCDTDTPSFSFVDDLENGVGKWTMTNGSYKRWQLDSPYGPYAQSGLHSLYADDYPQYYGNPTDARATLTSFVVPANAYLHFAHAYDFESFSLGDTYYFDGGVLEYSANGSSTWLNAGSLIDFNGYKGMIYSGWNNPLGGQPAFVGASHGYISTRLNLVSLAGKTVTFRWRMGLDDIGSAWGWWVDNVKVYTCKNTPAAAVLVSPLGNIGINYTPTYTWNKVENATWYYLWVNGPSGNVIKQWYNASLNCSGGTCSATPDTTLAGGNYTWWIQTWNPAGHGSWSSGMTFSIAPLAAATLISPTGEIGTNYTPTYTWDKVTGATWYYLWVNGPSGNVIKQWYDASLVCGANTCSATPARSLSAGNHTWWVQTWNPGGYGLWSAGMSFSPSLPGAATLTSPSGSIATNTPTYIWSEVPGATWYYLWVNGPSGNLTKQWLETSDVCGANTCSATPVKSLNTGNHTWWIQTWNPAGYGPWSSAANFTIP